MTPAGAPGRPTLLDALLPEFDFGSRHAIGVAAPPAVVFAAAEAHRLDSSPLVRLLYRLRGLGTAPGALRAGALVVLAERPGEEIVLGTAGRFWAFDERRAMTRLRDARAFAEFDQPGTAKAAVSLRVDPLPGGGTRLATETRVRCTDAAAYWRFALYWAVIKAFSGWLRRDTLARIRREALAAPVVATAAAQR